MIYGVDHDYQDTASIYPSVDDMKTIHIDYMKGLSMAQLLHVADYLGIGQQKSQLTFILMHLYDLFVERDAEVVEINPMLITFDNKLVVNHAKILIDRDSEYRQQELVMQRDRSQ